MIARPSPVTAQKERKRKRDREEGRSVQGKSGRRKTAAVAAAAAIKPTTPSRVPSRAAPG